MGGAERPLTDSRSQVLQLREGKAANHVSPSYAHQNQAANRSEAGADRGGGGGALLWIQRGTTERSPRGRERKKRKSKLRKEKIHRGGGAARTEPEDVEFRANSLTPPRWTAGLSHLRRSWISSRAAVKCWTADSLRCLDRLRSALPGYNTSRSPQLG